MKTFSKLIAILAISATIFLSAACDPTASNTPTGKAFQAFPGYGENPSAEVEAVKTHMVTKFGWGETGASCWVEGHMFYGSDAATIKEMADQNNNPLSFTDNRMKNYNNVVANNCTNNVMPSGFSDWRLEVLNPTTDYLRANQ